MEKEKDKKKGNVDRERKKGNNRFSREELESGGKIVETRSRNERL